MEEEAVLATEKLMQSARLIQSGCVGYATSVTATGNVGSGGLEIKPSRSPGSGSAPSGPRHTIDAILGLSGRSANSVNNDRSDSGGELIVLNNIFFLISTYLMPYSNDFNIFSCIVFLKDVLVLNTFTKAVDE